MAITKTKLLAWLLVAVSLAGTTTSCETLSFFRPAITAAALTLLHELDALLQAYEGAQNLPLAHNSDFPADSAAHDALYRDIVELLDVCLGKIPPKTLAPYHNRLKAASRRGS